MFMMTLIVHFFFKNFNYVIMSLYQARPLLSHALETEEFAGLADSRLEGNYVAVDMFRLIEAAAACVRHSSAKRPTMGQVNKLFSF